ncbi:tetratricopeptide repeat protein [Opitutus terrae]|uniref:Tetratricopeptide TPR_2 repeat protein n=1 Tax=Opitutus terrae (strain DSM 11246 / JCM 15787 / PB90-1) TaxID=452637 RepID=B1ZS37_OPITP|nr:tetratricopeptide repeat protein [Opitutus terrae]ACB74713.1 Tetratricopeptide TPR_2 repeat protein [Opitutus terrae PB90-1]
MSAHLARAQLLLAQSRPGEAEREAMLALSADPQDTAALALLALSRCAQQKRPEALAAAESAVGLAPDNAYLHYVHALTLHHLDREDAAHSGINAALRLNPEDPDFFSLLAGIELARGNAPAALTAAEQALAIDSEHVEAANLRAMALVRLGRKAEATETVDFALQHAPNSALSHANQGWTYLHRNDPRRAQEFFREALRLDPTMEFARQGMLEALKARNPVYRAMLAYFLWMGRQGAKLQWGIIIGTYFFSRFLNSQLRGAEHASWALILLALVFYLFVYLTWTAHPMFNLLLRFDRFGRYVLSRDERIATYWFGPLAGAAVAALTWWVVTRAGLPLLATLLLAALSICGAATFQRQKRARLILGGCTVLLALVAAMVVFEVVIGPVVAGGGVMSVFVMGFLGIQILANVLSR